MIPPADRSAMPWEKMDDDPACAPSSLEGLGADPYDPYDPDDPAIWELVELELELEGWETEEYARNGW